MVRTIAMGRIPRIALRTILGNFTRNDLRAFAKYCGIYAGKNKVDTIFNLLEDRDKFAKREILLKVI